MARIVSINSKLEPLLGFLYPNHAILPDNAPMVGDFIIHKEVTSPAQADSLKFYYPNSIFISNRIFDEVLTPERLRYLCIEYSKKHLGNRRTKFDVDSETAAEEFVNFMYGVFTEDEEQSINTLFDLAGSTAFIPEFIKLSTTIPVHKLQAAMNTFVSKVLSAKEGSSVFYLRKASVLGKKIRTNMVKALDDYINRIDDETGLSICKFYSDLFS